MRGFPTVLEYIRIYTQLVPRHKINICQEMLPQSSMSLYSIGKPRVSPLRLMKVRNQPKLRRVSLYSHLD